MTVPSLDQLLNESGEDDMGTAQRLSKAIREVTDHKASIAMLLTIIRSQDRRIDALEKQLERIIDDRYA